MSITYNISTDFAAKDSLPDGDPEKVVKGAAHSTEFLAIQAAFELAAPKSSPTFTGTSTFTNVSVSGTFQLGGAAVTASASELNKLDGVTATTAEINYLDGVTSNLQTQLDSKQGSGSYASSAQGALADSSLQPSDNVSELTNDAGYITDYTVTESDVTQHESAVDAGSVDGYDIVVDSGTPSGTDANTIYFVT